MDFQILQVLEVLSQTPATVRSMLGNLSDEWIFASADENDWSAFDIIGHFIHGEETDWIPRAEIILAQGENIAFEPFDRFAQFEISKGKTISDLLQTFADLRRKNIEILKSWNLTKEQLSFKGVHPELGEVTLEQLLATWMVHDLTHIRQIATVLAKQQSENVGAWKAYLSILTN